MTPPSRSGRPPYESDDAAYPGQPAQPARPERDDRPFDQYEQLEEYASPPRYGQPPDPHGPPDLYQPQQPQQPQYRQPPDPRPQEQDGEPYAPSGPTLPQRGPGRFADPRYGETRRPRDRQGDQYAPPPAPAPPPGHYPQDNRYAGPGALGDPRYGDTAFTPPVPPAPPPSDGEYADYRYADTLLPQTPSVETRAGDLQRPGPPAGSPFDPTSHDQARNDQARHDQRRLDDTGQIGSFDQPDQYGQTDQWGQPGDFVRQEHQTGTIPVTSSTTANVMRSSAVMAAGTAVSRVLGFVRAALLLAVLAPGHAADAFSVANNVPNALYILLAGGVLNAVLVPQITRAAKMPDGGQEYVDRLMTAAVTLLFVATAVITAAAPLIIHIYATSNWQPPQFALAEAFALWCLPQIFWYGLYTMLGQVLNARGSFGPFMWAPVVNNVVGIAGLVLFLVVAGTGQQPLGSWTSTKILLLAGTATLGVIAQAIILIPALRAAGVTYRVRWGLRGFGLRTATRVAGWTFAAVLVQQVGYVVISQVTTAGGSLAGNHPAFGTGKAIYDQAFLLFMLPHSLIAVSLVTALFTRMSVNAADKDMDGVRSDLSLGLRLTGLATVVSAAAFIAMGSDITRALFPGSTPSVTRGLGYVATAMMIGLVPFSAQYLFQRVFYAFEDAKTPFLIQVPVTATWAIGNLFFLVVLRHSHPVWIVVGVGASMTISNSLGAMLSVRLLRRRLGDLDMGHVISTHLKYVGAAATGGVVAFVLTHLVHAELGDSWFATLIAAAVGGVALLVVYGFTLRRLKVTELDDALGPFLRRRRSKRA